MRAHRIFLEAAGLSVGAVMAVVCALAVAVMMVLDSS